MCTRSSERLAAAQKIFNISSSSSHLCLMSSPSFPFPPPALTRGRSDHHHHHHLVFLWLRFSPDAAARSSGSSSSSPPSFAAHLSPLFLMYIRPELGFVPHVQPEPTEILQVWTTADEWGAGKRSAIDPFIFKKFKYADFRVSCFNPFTVCWVKSHVSGGFLAPDIFTFFFITPLKKIKKAPTQLWQKLVAFSVLDSRSQLVPIHAPLLPCSASPAALLTLHILVAPQTHNQPRKIFFFFFPNNLPAVSEFLPDPSGHWPRWASLCASCATWSSARLTTGTAASVTPLSLPPSHPPTQTHTHYMPTHSHRAHGDVGQPGHPVTVAQSSLVEFPHQVSFTFFYLLVRMINHTGSITLSVWAVLNHLNNTDFSIQNALKTWTETQQLLQASGVVVLFPAADGGGRFSYFAPFLTCWFRLSHDTDWK